ncbi:MAG: T9SS type A sorting domain-containing protein [Flavobacteriales bacterium]|nr:T9SS type A sorting domain-containing protein [Flavobacteriales bacterium]
MGQVAHDSVFVNNYFWSNCFTDTVNGFVVGDNGAIYKTLDGGCNWSLTSSGVDGRLMSVHFPSSQIGYVVGRDDITSSSIVLKTLDGGISWNLLNTTISVNDYFTSVYFLNDSVGYVCGDYNTIMKTSDGGVSWNLQTIQSSTYNPQYNDISFVNSDTGFAVSGTGSWPSTLAKTYDGGNTWQLDTIFQAYSLNSVHFFNANYGYACGYDQALAGVLLRTTDGGVNWSTVNNSSSWIKDMQFKDSLNGYIALTSGELLFTANGGSTWSTEYTFPQPVAGASIYITANDEWHLAGNSLDYSTVPPSYLGFTATSRECDNTLNADILIDPDIFKLYPNPASNNLTISFEPLVNEFQVRIFNVYGKLINTINNVQSNDQINVRELSSGIYFFEIQNVRSNIYFFKRVIIEKYSTPQN